MHRSGADAERLCRLEDACAGRQLRSDALDDIALHRTTTKPLSLAPSPREASFDPLDNHRALELGKAAHHLKHRLTGWRAGVDILLMTVEIDAFGAQFTEERN